MVLWFAVILITLKWWSDYLMKLSVYDHLSMCFVPLLFSVWEDLVGAPILPGPSFANSVDGWNKKRETINSCTSSSENRFIIDHQCSTQMFYTGHLEGNLEIISAPLQVPYDICPKGAQCTCRLGKNTPEGDKITGPKLFLSNQMLIT